METDNEISRLTVLKSAWQSQRNDLQYKIGKHYPSQITSTQRKIAEMETDLAIYTANKLAEFQMTIGGKLYDERAKARDIPVPPLNIIKR